jgi:PAS domain S-box-containing protein
MLISHSHTTQAVAATQAVLNTSLDAVVSMDIYGMIVGWNLPAEEVFGFKKEEVLGEMMHLKIIPEKFRCVCVCVCVCVMHMILM